jgi:predicted small lipoprotein YifL
MRFVLPTGSDADASPAADAAGGRPPSSATRLRSADAPVFLVALLALVVAGCAAKGPQYSPAALDQAEADGRLEAIHAELNAPKGGLARLSAGDQAVDRANVAERLVRRDLAQLSAALDGQRLSPPLPPRVPLARFAGFAELAALPGRWGPQGGERAAALLRSEEAKTREAIAERRRRAAALPAREHLARLALLAEIAALGGEGSAEAAALEPARREAAAALEREVLAALAADRPAVAEAGLAALATVAPEAAELPRLRAIARLLTINAAMRSAFDASQQELAWQRLEALAAEWPLALLRPEADAALSELRAAQLVRASAALIAERLADAREATLRARRLAGVLGERYVPPEENAYVGRLQRAAEAAAARGDPVREYGYRLLVEDMQPGYPGLHQTLRGVVATLGASAPRRVAIAVDALSAPTGEVPAAEDAPATAVQPPASPPPESAADPALARIVATAAAGDPGGLAQRVAAQLAGQLAERLPHDLRVVAGGSSDYTIAATLVDALIEREAVAGWQTRQVPDLARRLTNPAHAEWAALPPGERGQRAAPPEVIAVPEVEPRSLPVTHLRKRARLAIEFRLVAAAGPLLSDLVSVARAAETAHGLAVLLGAIGDDPAVEAPLPDDGEMLDALAAEAVQAIVERLAAPLSGAETAHAALADAALAAGDVEAALRHRASALAIAERKRLDAVAFRNAFTDLLLAAPPARLPAAASDAAATAPGAAGERADEAAAGAPVAVDAEALPPLPVIHLPPALPVMRGER